MRMAMVVASGRNSQNRSINAAENRMFFFLQLGESNQWYAVHMRMRAHGKQCRNATPHSHHILHMTNHSVILIGIYEV